MTEPLLEVRDLRTYFDTDDSTGDSVVRAVDGVSLHLAAGETLGIVGESGSGKSVACLSVLGLLPRPAARHPSGSVRLSGREILGLPEAELSRLRGDRVAMVFQDPMTSLNPFLTIGVQLAEVLEVHRGLSRPKAMARAHEVLEAVGISEAAARLQQHPHELSGGMRQRVLIAMALLCDPALLIADEPTTALDVTVQAQILELLHEQQKARGMGLVLVTHDLGVVAGVADRVAVMYAGRIVEEGRAEEVLGAPRHPYTVGLLASVPRLDDGRARLTPIEGLPPDLSALPRGCAFAPRCSAVRDRCRAEAPALVSLGGSRRAACWELGGESSKRL